MSSTSRRRTPVHLALPTSLPPTSLLTQAIVTYCSNIGSATSCVPGQRRLAVDQAVDPQRPASRVDDRREERGVDPVEAVVRHDDRGQAGDRRWTGPRRASSGGHGHRRRRDRRARRRPARRAGARGGRARRPRPRPRRRRRAPARITNARRDQSGIAAPARRARSPRRRRRGRPVEQPAEDPAGPTPTETAVATAAIAGLASGSPSEARKPTTPKATKPPAAIAKRRRAERARGRPR